MNLRDYAVRFEALSGSIVFFMLPFRPPKVDNLISQLDVIEPENVYIHKKTGEHRSIMPDEHRTAIETALRRKLKAVRSDWRTQRQWGSAQNTFCLCGGVTVDIETTGGDLDVELLAQFWRDFQDSGAASWPTFQMAISERVKDAWWEAYSATRDKTFAPAEPPEDAGAADDADPLPEGAPTTSAS